MHDKDSESGGLGARISTVGPRSEKRDSRANCQLSRRNERRRCSDLELWLCWSLVSESGSDLTKPLLAVVHGDLDQDELIRHVREIFPTYECALDNEIEFDQS